MFNRACGVRDRGFASPGKATNILYLDVDPRAIITQIDDKKVLRRAHDKDPIRGRHSDAPARRPCPICSRITSSTPSRLARAAPRVRPATGSASLPQCRTLVR